MLTLLNTAAIYAISGTKFFFFIHHSFCYWSISNLLIAQNTLYLTDRVLFVLEGSVILEIYNDNLPLLVITEIKVENKYAIISISSRSSPLARQ